MPSTLWLDDSTADGRPPHSSYHPRPALFTLTGVHYLGQCMVKHNRAIFICLASKTVYIKVTVSLYIDALNALRQFLLCRLRSLVRSLADNSSFARATKDRITLTLNCTKPRRWKTVASTHLAHHTVMDSGIADLPDVQSHPGPHIWECAYYWWPNDPSGWGFTHL